MPTGLSRIEIELSDRKFPRWDSGQQLLYKIWKEAWDNGYYRGEGEPYKPIGFDLAADHRWLEQARKVYRKVTSKPEEWEEYRREHRQPSKHDLGRHDLACIAAERAMAGHSTQSSSEVGWSDSSARKRRDDGANSQHNPRTSNLLTSRQYKPGRGLAKKTLRASTPTRIPGPFQRHDRKAEIDAALHASLSPKSASSETYGALPSSYRRLRKARSMFVPRHNGASSQQSSWPTPRARNRSLRSVTSSAVLQTNNLRVRLRRSLPFLRPKSTTTRRPCADYEWGLREEAVQMARAQFLDDLELQRIQEIQSTQHKMRLNRDDKPEDVTTRQARTPTLLLSPPIPADLPPGPQTCLRKRSFSSSFRSNFRKLLGKSVTSKRATPLQQLDSRDYYFPDLGIDLGHSSAFDSYLIPDISRTVQGRTCGSSEVEQELLEDVDQVPDILPPAVSRESLHSTSRSRVTSWTDSSIAGSIGLKSGPIDRNRLSVIKEDGGPHQPSSSAGRHIGGVEVFREPLQTVADDGQLLPPVDSHRVYSALVKRISQEEAEMETTRIALENINSNNGSHASMVERPTIRTVCSESSLATRVTAPPDEQRREVSTAPYTWHRTDNEMGPREDDSGAENRKERLAMEESQSTFFPFSSEQKSTAPSPFKRLLSERRRQKSGRISTRYSEGNSEDAGSVIAHAKAGHSILGRPRFGFSSESLYSRTTNGGMNEQYAPPIASSDDLSNVHRRGAGDFDTKSGTSRGHMRSSSDNSPEIDPSSSFPQTSTWNPWSETLTAMTAGAERQDSRQVHGHIQEGLGNVSNEVQQDRAKITFRTPTQRLKAMTSSSTPSPVATISVRKRRKDILKTSSCGVLNSISNKTGDEVKVDAGLRKFSPGRVRKILQEKKSQLSVLQDNNKENIPTDEEKSTFNSSAGKSHTAYGARNTSARLRKRASRMTLRSHKDPYSTPQSEKKSTASTPDRFEDSPGERAKDQLVARLSRPFNMDVPPHNRPFDSTYLGKRTPGHPDPMGNSRLSVARPIPESIGGSPSRNTAGPEGDESTAAQLAPSAVGRGTSKVLGIFGSRRMVSSFLRSRKVSKSTSEDDLGAAEGSPAFI